MFGAATLCRPEALVQGLDRGVGLSGSGQRRTADPVDQWDLGGNPPEIQGQREATVCQRERTVVVSTEEEAFRHPGHRFEYVSPAPDVLQLLDGRCIELECFVIAALSPP